jgi:DNA-binding NarL/FixJ family response regulator
VRRAVLVVEDDVSFSRAVSRVFEQDWTVRRAYSVAEALAFLAGDDPFVGIICDYRLPDGDGLQVIERARARYPRAHVSFVTAHLSAELVNTIHSLGAGYVVKDNCGPNLLQIAQRLKLREQGLDDRVCAALEELAARYALTTREQDIVTLVVADKTREAMLQSLKITNNTLKSQIRSLLAKCGHRSLDALRRAVLTLERA